MHHHLYYYTEHLVRYASSSWGSDSETCRDPCHHLLPHSIPAISYSLTQSATEIHSEFESSWHATDHQYIACCRVLYRLTHSPRLECTMSKHRCLIQYSTHPSTCMEHLVVVIFPFVYHRMSEADLVSLHTTNIYVCRVSECGCGGIYMYVVR